MERAKPIHYNMVGLRQSNCKHPPCAWMEQCIFQKQPLEIATCPYLHGFHHMHGWSSASSKDTPLKLQPCPPTGSGTCMLRVERAKPIHNRHGWSQGIQLQASTMCMDGADNHLKTPSLSTHRVWHLHVGEWKGQSPFITEWLESGDPTASIHHVHGWSRQPFQTASFSTHKVWHLHIGKWKGPSPFITEWLESGDPTASIHHVHGWSSASSKDSH